MTFLLRWWKPIAVILLAAGLYFGGMYQGHHGEVQRQAVKQSKQAVKDQKAVTKRAEVRSHVEQETQKLPDAPIQRIGDADPDSAAGRLRAWSRDKAK